MTFVITKINIILSITMFQLFILTFSEFYSHGPTAETEQGVYIGQEKMCNDTIIYYWYGIPYARQPINNLRWMPPQELERQNGSKKAWNATVCPQQYDVGFTQSESCLTLNIYSPANATNLPVYIWIHGGGFIGGAAIQYDASSFISIGFKHASPIVVVTVNYRLGLLGFLADQALYDEKSGEKNQSTTGNYGILDQIMAIQWIRKNIVGFGGDPTQLTIGGESAGGISVTVLLTSPLTLNNSFQRAIIQSGVIWPTFAIELQSAIEHTGYILRSNSNCTDVVCLRNLTAEAILEAQVIVASKSNYGIIVSPVIDGHVLTETMEESYVRGTFRKVPVLVGSNANETTLFTCPLFNRTFNMTDVEVYMKTLYSSAILEKIPYTYGNLSNVDNPLAYLNNIYSDSWIHCGSRRVSIHFSQHNLSTFFYTYNHRLSITASCIGVFHTAELIMFFPSIMPYLSIQYNLTALEEKLSSDMILYWINFIHTGNPNGNHHLTYWSAYDMLLNNDFVIDTVSRMRKSYYDGVCSKLWDRYVME